MLGEGGGLIGPTGEEVVCRLSMPTSTGQVETGPGEATQTQMSLKHVGGVWSLTRTPTPTHLEGLCLAVLNKVV